MAFNSEKTRIQKSIDRCTTRLSIFNVRKTEIETTISELTTAGLDSDPSIVPIMTQLSSRLVGINSRINSIMTEKTAGEAKNNRVHSAAVQTKLNTLGASGRVISGLFEKSEIKQSLVDNITTIEGTGGLSQATKDKTIQQLINNYDPDNYA